MNAEKINDHRLKSFSWGQRYFERKWLAILFDVLSIPLAWYLAFWLRFNMQWLPSRLLINEAIEGFMILFVMQMLFYSCFRVYRGLWRFSSISDMNRILRSVFCAAVLSFIIFYEFELNFRIPRSILPLYAMALIFIQSAARLFFRYYLNRAHQKSKENEDRRVLIIGAGQAGESLIRDLVRHESLQPVVIVDDNKSKIGLEIHGVRVLGTIDELPVLVAKFHIDLIFIAIPSLNSLEMRRVVTLCDACQIPFHTLPSLHALTSGQVEVNALRKVKIEDLLGRDKVTLSLDKIASLIENKKVLVTGGGGSIGSELCRQILAFQPKHLFILDNSEFNLYKIDQELRLDFPEIPITIALDSVFDAIAVEDLFKKALPNIVFHAAAYKHVPLLENQMRSAVQNNIIGTKILAEKSARYDVDVFVLISSDKAVNPSSLMGTTKRVAEIFCQNLSLQVATKFITVRFGNVLGSVGSVMHLFQKQLAEEGPITVTHPEVTRYFMTISEACQLILQAMIEGSGGEILVMDMGEPIKINYLAEQMIRLSGKTPHVDIKIQYTGLRPGEKLYEELFHISEELKQTNHDKLFKAKLRPIDWLELNEIMKQIKNACDKDDLSELYILLKNLVPESKIKQGFYEPTVEEI